MYTTYPAMPVILNLIVADPQTNLGCEEHQCCQSWCPECYESAKRFHLAVVEFSIIDRFIVQHLGANPKEWDDFEADMKLQDYLDYQRSTFSGVNAF